MLSKSVTNPALLDEAADALIPQLTKQLRDFAFTSGWPSRLVSKLNVELSGGNLIVVYPDEYASEIENLEYGNAAQLPNAAIRPFILRTSKTLKTVLDNMVVGSLIEEVGVFNG
jgi:hypothetical protein